MCMKSATAYVPIYTDISECIVIDSVSVSSVHAASN